MNTSNNHTIFIWITTALLCLFLVGLFAQYMISGSLDTNPDTTIEEEIQAKKDADRTAKAQEIGRILTEEREKYGRQGLTHYEVIAGMDADLLDTILDEFVDPNTNPDGSYDPSYMENLYREQLAQEDLPLEQRAFFEQRLAKSLMTYSRFKRDAESQARTKEGYEIATYVGENHEYPNVFRAEALADIADNMLVDFNMDLVLDTLFGQEGTEMAKNYTPVTGDQMFEYMRAASNIYAWSARLWYEPHAYASRALVLAEMALSGSDTVKQFENEYPGYLEEKIVFNYASAEDRLDLLEARYNPELNPEAGYSDQKISEYYRMSANLASKLYFLTHKQDEFDENLINAINARYEQALTILREVPAGQEVFTRGRIARVGLNYSFWLGTLDNERYKSIIDVLLQPFFEDENKYIRDDYIKNYAQRKQDPYFMGYMYRVAQVNDDMRNFMVVNNLATNDEIDADDTPIERGIFDKDIGQIIDRGVILVR